MFNYLSNTFQSQKKSWDNYGFLLEKIFSIEDTFNLGQVLEDLRIKRNSNFPETWGEYDIYSHPHKDDEKILKLFGHPFILSLLEKILEEEVLGIQSMAYFKPPGELGRDAHQDAFYTDSEWNKTVNVIIALDDCNKSNGCLWSYQSSHFLPILDVGLDEDRLKTNVGFWANERGRATLMPNRHNFPKVYHECKAGDVLFIHSHLVHGSDENKSDKFRRSIVLSYKTKSAKIREGFKMKREPFDVYQLRDKYYVHDR